MKFTYLGHSCFIIETAGKKILFDPFISGNELAKDIDIAAIKPDYILVSHGHQDHILDLVSIAKQSGALCIATWEIYSWLGKQGITNAHPMNLGGKWEFDFGTVQMVQAIHSSSFPDGSYAGCAAGFVVTTPEACFYYAGDTALFSDMKQIGRQNELDFVVLPVGDNFTMGLDDAATAAKWLKCHEVFGVHFDTFPYIKLDHAEAKERFQRKGHRLHLPAIGQVIEVA